MKCSKVPLLVSAIFLLCALVYCGGDSSNNGGEDTDVFKLSGYVEMDGSRVADCNVKFEFGEGSANAGTFTYPYSRINKTNANGEFEFTKKVTQVQAKYKVSAEHPITGVYTTTKEGTAMNGMDKTEVFILSSTQN